MRLWIELDGKHLQLTEEDIPHLLGMRFPANTDLQYVCYFDPPDTRTHASEAMRREKTARPTHCFLLRKSRLLWRNQRERGSSAPGIPVLLELIPVKLQLCFRRNFADTLGGGNDRDAIYGIEIAIWDEAGDSFPVAGNEDFFAAFHSVKQCGQGIPFFRYRYLSMSTPWLSLRQATSV